MNLLEEEEFPCPYCAEINTISMDFLAGENQKLIIDCEVCCRPIVIRIRIQESKIIAFDALGENV